MILHAQAKHGKRVYHGWCFARFSGDCHEWQEVGEAFADYSRLYVDLEVMVVRRRLASMDLMMSPTYCVKPWLVTTSLTFGWWGTRLADGWR